MPMAITALRGLQVRLLLSPAVRPSHFTATNGNWGYSSETFLHCKLNATRSFGTSKYLLRANPGGPLRSSHAFAEPIITTEAVRDAGDHRVSVTEPFTPTYDLSCLPLASLLRNLLTSTISSHPILLNPALNILSRIAYSKSPFLSPSHNPIIRCILKATVYSQFCAGETPAEVQATISGLKSWGIQGVLLGWAREVELRSGDSISLTSSGAETAVDRRQISEWISGVRKTIGLVESGDVVSVKFTGAGELNLQNLQSAAAPSPTLARGLTELCELAASRGVTIVIDAEQVALQPGIEAWTLDLQRRYNRKEGVIVGTYQAYLRKTPALLARELAIAAEEGFVLGIKLVRGAYLGSDPRNAIQPSKEATDFAYDGVAEAIVRKEWSASLQPPSNTSIRFRFPRTRLILATHNATSAQKILDLQQSATNETPPIIHAQLMGMAEHVSCRLVQARKEALTTLKNLAIQEDNVEERMKFDAASLKPNALSPSDPPTVPRPYKYLVWGTTDECLKYLVRRGEENRDAIVRTEESRRMLARELRRRLIGF